MRTKSECISELLRCFDKMRDILKEETMKIPFPICKCGNRLLVHSETCPGCGEEIGLLARNQINNALLSMKTEEYRKKHNNIIILDVRKSPRKK